MPDAKVPGYEVTDVGALTHRIEELLADNDDMRLEIWTLNVALRTMAERISELENNDA